MPKFTVTRFIKRQLIKAGGRAQGRALAWHAGGSWFNPQAPLKSNFNIMILNRYFFVRNGLKRITGFY